MEFPKQKDSNQLDLLKRPLVSDFNKEIDIDFQEIILIEKSIPQYNVGHLDKVMQIEELSPNNLTLLGSYMYGVSLIDIIIKSKELARDF